MSDFSAPYADLAAMFETHGLAPEMRGDWLTIDSLYPAIRAYMSGRLLYVEVALNEKQILTELYPAEGGLDMFRDGVFPVLLSAFWNRHNPGQVTRQIIRRADGPWQVFVGPYLRRIDTGERPPVPYLLFETIDAFLRKQSLARDLHWLSTGIAVDSDGSVADIRLDGVRQPATEKAIERLDWQHDGHDYTLRNVILTIRL